MAQHTQEMQCVGLAFIVSQDLQQRCFRTIKLAGLHVLHGRLQALIQGLRIERGHRCGVMRLSSAQLTLPALTFQSNGTAVPNPPLAVCGWYANAIEP